MVGFYLAHRTTKDLDLFTLDDEIDNGARLVRDVAVTIGATIEPIQTAPDLRRILVSREPEAIVVDLVREYVFQVETDKRSINGIRIDTPEEILANKLCALLSRSEIRDLIDVKFLEETGVDLDAALENAAKKDTGLTPAQLAWVIGQIELGDDATLPSGISVAELRSYINDIVTRLSNKAYP